MMRSVRAKVWPKPAGRSGGALASLLPLAAGAVLLLGCETQTCPDPDLAQGTWIPSGGTKDLWRTVAATETELCVYDYSISAIRVFDPLTQEQTISSTPPYRYNELAPSGMAATQDLLLAVSGSDGQDYLPIAQLWDRASDTWLELEMPEYAPPGQDYQVHWTGDVFIMLGALASDNTTLGGGAVFDPDTLEWRPLFGGEGPDGFGSEGRGAARSIWTNHGLFWWSIDGQKPPEAWIYSPATDRWSQIATASAPPAQWYSLTTDGDRVWLSPIGGEGATWQVDLETETWKPREPPAEAPPDLRVGVAMPVGDWFRVGAPGCEEGVFWIYQPETGEWSVGRPSPAGGLGPGWIGVIAGHLVTYGVVGDGWDNGQMYTYYPDCEPGTLCE